MNDMKNEVTESVSAQSVNPSEGAATSKTTKRAKKRKWPIVIGVIAIVLVAAGGGFLVWHEQPSFCNAICHSPMDPYVESYFEGDDLARVHMENDVTCLECHNPEISQQISEAGKWVTGDFRDPLDAIDYPDEDCIECHPQEEIQQATAGLEKNPHTDAHQVVKCNTCHKSHDDQVDYCGQCHDNGGQTMIHWSE